MKKIAGALGWVAVVIAALLTFAGIAVWPPGGLMFALPFVFLMPAALLWVVGLLLLRVSRAPGATAAELAKRHVADG
ncbi:MAG: hypothetical protein ACM35F_06820 [Betaproteobacteria bacterium]